MKWPTGFTFQIIAVRPESKGKIGLKSDDPWDSPAILPQYLTDKQGRDAATLRWALATAKGSAGSCVRFESQPDQQQAGEAGAARMQLNPVHSKALNILG